ncbi:dipeptidase [Candidatus Spongiisocius sp.]|uniref:dipeptidase n=1 Tax=Candidatus Spongiisocius sp. TaxID=3101273 RepID=UPI003B5BF702
MPTSGGFRVADAHNDLLLAVEHQRRRGYSDPFGDFWLPQLREGNVALQVLPVYTEEEFAGSDALRRAMVILETARWMAELHPSDVAIAETGKEIEAISGAGRIALVLALEGGEPFGSDLGLIDGFARLGVRIASMTWNRRTMLADGVGERATGGGLTRLGRLAVEEFERCGIVVDISHLSDAGVRDVLATATEPVMATHSSCRALCAHPRNLTDTQIAQVAGSGGIVCVNAFGGFLGDRPSIARYVDHIKHAVAMAGPDAVGLGADFIDDLLPILDPILQGALVDEMPVIPDLRSARDYPAVAEVLTHRLGESITARVMSENLIRFLVDLLP